MALRAAVLRHFRFPVPTEPYLKQHSWLGGASLQLFSSHGGDHLSKDEVVEREVVERVISFVQSLPNDHPSKFENVTSMCQTFYIKLALNPSSASYEKLTIFFCNFLKVHLAFDLVKETCEAGFIPSNNTLNFILDASWKSGNFNLVHQIYSIICKYDIKPNGVTFTRMIKLCARMKDFDSAWGILNDFKKMNLTPTIGMYHAIMKGYYREKNIRGAWMVMDQMRQDKVEVDTQIVCLIITNCYQEEEINKWYNDIMTSGIKLTKQIFIALANAYSNCGQLEKAKQILLDKRILVNDRNEAKNVLVHLLAKHGQMDDALDAYNKIKQTGCHLEHNTIISLMEHLRANGELNIMFQLLDELKGSRRWKEGCYKVILFCMLHKHLSSAIDLLRQLRNNFCEDDHRKANFYDEIFDYIADSDDPTYLKMGLELLRVIKYEFGQSLSRKSLDFLLTACVNAKDLDNSRFIWKEYELAGIRYDLMAYLRMYHALMAGGDRRSAKNFLRKILNINDHHIRLFIKYSETCFLKGTDQGQRPRSNH